MSQLVLDDVTVRYGDVVAVDGLSLEVADGEVLALLGPSGCGKSTVLRAVAGLEPLAGGAIRHAGRDLSGVAVHQRQLGLMFQDHVLFPNLDVAGNIGFGLRQRRWPRRRVDERVAELLELVGLPGYGPRPVTALSGGEAQRVALARALAPQPRLLMLDEPLGALDRSLREQLAGELRDLLRQVGQTALHVTHDQSEAFTVADRVAVLRAGRLVQAGPPAQVWAEPVDEFVARFLGHPNVWLVEVAVGGAVRWGSTRLGQRPALPPGPVRLVVPSAALSLGPGPLCGRVQAVELREGIWRVTLATSEGPVILNAEEPPPVASRCNVEIDLTRCRPLSDAAGLAVERPG